VSFKRSDKEAENMRLIRESCLKLRRKLTKSAAKKGANAIISYRQSIDNEGAKSKRIVIRGYGTAAYIRPIGNTFEMASTLFSKKGLETTLKSKEGLKNARTQFLPTAALMPDEEYNNVPPISKDHKVQFITSSSYPGDAQVWFGSTVSARSVRLISMKTTERDSWWSELRHEISKNTLALGCSHILGYRELVTIFQDVMILNIIGTAVKIKESKVKKE